jgi:VWFA-related protein
MKTRIVIGLLLAAAGFGAAGSWAGSQDRPAREWPLRHETSATVKLVPVRVLGPDGRPVIGLKKEDFVLYEDGAPRKITEFEAHALSGGDTMGMPGVPPFGAEEARRDGGMNRKLFIFFDFQRSDREGKIKATQAALQFLEREVRPGDEVGVLGFYSMSGFVIRQYLTGDMARVRAAIDSAREAPPSRGFSQQIIDDSVGPRVRKDIFTDITGSSLNSVFVEGTSLFQRLDFSERMEDVAEVFKTIPGNKSLILFTSREMGPAAERLGRLLGAAGVPVYVINNQDRQTGPLGTPVKRFGGNDSLQSLAAASGGVYFADINDAAAIAREVSDLSGHFYVLGYYVSEAWEGRFHKIRVEVARPGLTVLAQAGYSDPKPFDRMTDFEKELHLQNLLWAEHPSSNPVPISIEPLVVSTGTEVQACLLAQFEVDGKTGPPASKVEIISLLKEAKGGQPLCKRWEVDLAPHAGKRLWPYLITALEAGVYEACLVVRDLRTGEACLGRAGFEVRATPAAGIIVSAPLLIEPGAEATYMKLAPRRSGAEGATLVDLYRLIPKAGHPIIGEVGTGARRILAVLPVEVRLQPSKIKPVLAVEAGLVSRPASIATPLEVALRDSKAFGGIDEIMVTEIVLPAGLTPGEYELVIAVTDTGSDRKAVVRKPLTIR